MSHLFFQLLEPTLARAQTEQTATVLFEVEGLKLERVLITLGPSGGALRQLLSPLGYEPTLTVYTDAHQLSELIERGASDRPLRIAGDPSVLARLAPEEDGSTGLLALRSGLPRPQ
jgi:hypothetical protein